MRRRSRIFLTVSLGTGLIGLGAWMISSVFFAHAYDPAGSSTRDDVTELTSVPPPVEAREIRVATFTYGQARLVFVRFAAPVDVCQKYVAAVMPNVKLMPLTWEDKRLDLDLIANGTHWLRDLRWFDLPHAHAFWSVQSGQPAFTPPSSQNIAEFPDVLGADANTQLQGYLRSAVRVDTARGVFYLLKSN